MGLLGRLSGSLHISPTGYLHCTTSCGQHIAGWESVKGGTYAILRHMVSGFGDSTRVEGQGMGERLGRGEGDRTGLNTHAAKLQTEFIEDRESGP